MSWQAQHPSAPAGGSGGGAPATLSGPIVIQTQSGWQRFVSWVGWTGFAISALLLVSQFIALGEYFQTTDGVSEKYHSGSKYAVDKIAVIDVSGVILEGEGFVKHQIDLVRDDEAVKAVVLRVDSPGGTVTGSDYLYHHLNRLREERKLPIVVSMGGIAASGGYYVSMSVADQAKAIFAEPTTTTGSIGVIVPHYDISGLLARFDVKDDSIVSHPRKQMLSMTRPLDAEERKVAQVYVNESFERFLEIVRSGRPSLRKDDEALRALATGEVFTANQAKKLGLVDEIGFIEDAIQRAKELANLEETETRIVKYSRPPTFLGLGGFAQSAGGQRSDLATLLELGAPRAWYLSTSLPTLLTSRRAD